VVTAIVYGQGWAVALKNLIFLSIKKTARLNRRLTSCQVKAIRTVGGEEGM